MAVENFRTKIGNKGRREREKWSSREEDLEAYAKEQINRRDRFDASFASFESTPAQIIKKRKK